MLGFLESSGDSGLLGSRWGSGKAFQTWGCLQEWICETERGGKAFQVQGINTSGEARNEETTDLFFSARKWGCPGRQGLYSPVNTAEVGLDWHFVKITLSASEGRWMWKVRVGGGVSVRMTRPAKNAFLWEGRWKMTWLSGHVRQKRSRFTRNSGSVISRLVNCPITNDVRKRELSGRWLRFLA